MYAICDIGSNTVKTHFFKVCENNFEKIDSITYPARLISYINGNLMNDEGIDLLCKLIEEFKAKSDARGCVFHAFATASLRRAQNSDKIIEAVYGRTGVRIDLISGEKEAELCTLGVLHEIGEASSGILMDMGGGSTEIIKISKGNILSAGSMPFGSLSLYRENVAGNLPDDEESAKITNYARDAYTKLGTPCDSQFYVGGGTCKAILKLLGTGKGVCTVETADFLRLKNKIVCGEISFDDLKKCVSERAKSIMPGLIAICEILHLSHAEKVTFVTAGAREGYLLSIL